MRYRKDDLKMLFRQFLINKLLPLSTILSVLYFVLLCFHWESSIGSSRSSNNSDTLIIVITPTHGRLERLADMTRFSQTLSHVPQLHWIVVEDGAATVPAVDRILARSRVPYVYLATQSQPGFPRRGWTHRNLALSYIRENYKERKGVVYFGDDDNSYDIRLFDNYIRHVKTIGIWAVGLVGGAFVEAPKVVKGKIEAWDVVFAPKRNFATDMAGFAVNLQLIMNANASFNEKCTKSAGMGPESCFLSQFGLKKEQLQPFGYDDQPKEVLVWHTKTSKSKAKGDKHGYVVE